MYEDLIEGVEGGVGVKKEGDLWLWGLELVEVCGEINLMNVGEGCKVGG